ncbi:MAG: hypothetical protein ACREP4_10780 [Stenotrophomonas sp.]|uniref:hypothetical protein n=1 Tax=Stenotrophomonas sp. TaxID=69392 RepID=UPI003D6DA439
MQRFNLWRFPPLALAIASAANLLSWCLGSARFGAVMTAFAIFVMARVQRAMLRASCSASP